MVIATSHLPNMAQRQLALPAFGGTPWRAVRPQPRMAGAVVGANGYLRSTTGQPVIGTGYNKLLQV